MEKAPDGPYVYQPHPVTRKDGKLWHVGGMPDGMSREQAQAIVAVLIGSGNQSSPEHSDSTNRSAAKES